MEWGLTQMVDAGVGRKEGMGVGKNGGICYGGNEQWRGIHRSQWGFLGVPGIERDGKVPHRVLGMGRNERSPVLQKQQIV